MWFRLYLFVIWVFGVRLCGKYCVYVLYIVVFLMYLVVSIVIIFVNDVWFIDCLKFVFSFWGDLMGVLILCLRMWLFLGV